MNGEHATFIQALFDAVPVPFFYKNREGVYLYCNDHFLRFIGRPREEIIGLTAHDISPAKQADIYDEKDRQLYENPGDQTYESTVISSDGACHYVVFTKTTTVDAQGEVTGIAGVITDITEIKQYERALHEQDLKLQKITQTATDAIVMVDEKGLIKFWNDAASNIFGYPQEEALYANINELITFYGIKDRECYLLRSVDYLLPQSHQHLALAAESHAGRKHLVELSLGSALFSDHWHTICIFRDITRREAERAEHQMKAVAFDAASNAIVITDQVGRIQYVNAAFENITGYTQAEARGRYTRLLKSGRHNEPFYQELWRTISGGHTWHGEVSNLRKDGQEYTADMTITPVTNPQGVIHHYIGIQQDITRRKLLEEAQRKADRHRQQVIERTGRVAGLGVLAAGLAHEINNPLQGMMGEVSIIKRRVRGQRDNDLLGHIEKLENGIMRAAKLVKNLSILGETPPGTSGPADLLKAYAVIKQLFGPHLRKKQVLLKDRFEGEARPVAISEHELTHIFTDLLRNALDACAAQSGKIELKISFTDAHVLIECQDNGQGMEPDELQQAFNPFYTTRGPGRSGLGLTVIESVVRAAGGQMDISSEAGVGTVCTLHLPYADSQDRAAQPQSGLG